MDYQKYLSYYRQYSPLIYGLGLKLLGAEDAASQVLEEVFVTIAGRGLFSSHAVANKAYILQLTYKCINQKLGKPSPPSAVKPGVMSDMLQPSNN